jgi:hypothetical protein
VKRILAGVGAVVGLVLVVAAVLVALVVAVAGGGGRSTSAGFWAVAVVLGLLALTVALWKVRGRLDASSDRPVAWARDEGFATPAPERTDDEYALSSDDFARRIEEAGTAARSEGTVVDGVAVVRPALRETLIEAMVQGEYDPESARETLSTGEWTDDQVAASVIDAEVPPPELSIRQRLLAWLFPERAVRRRLRRAVQELAEVADESLPTVPGQTAPRTVPVRKPRLEELQRDAEGRLQGAVDPDAIARGPEPPDPDLDLEPGGVESGDGASRPDGRTDPGVANPGGDGSGRARGGSSDDGLPGDGDGGAPADTDGTSPDEDDDDGGGLDEWSGDEEVLDA